MLTNRLNFLQHIVHGIGDGEGTDPILPKGDEDLTFGFRGPGDIQYDLPKTIKAGEHEVDLNKLLGHAISSERKRVKKDNEQIKADLQAEYKPLFEQMKEKDTQLSELQEKLREIEEANLSAEEKAKLEIARETEKVQKQANEHQKLAERNWELFKENKINNDIYAALSGHDLTNPEQTAILLKTLGQASLIDNNGQYSTMLKMQFDGDLQELPPKELVQKFLALPENSHHLKNNLRSGGGSSVGGRAGTGGVTQYTSVQMQDERIRAEYTKKLKAGEAVEIVPG
jgi:hypothetical protein